jgi:hypothetical protein
VNVSRCRRHLIAARRYEYRQFLPGQAPGPVWHLEASESDNRRSLQAIVRLTARKYRLQLEYDYSWIVDDSSNCGGWNWDPPCGGCVRCLRDMTWYYADPWRRAHRWAKKLLRDLE